MKIVFLDIDGVLALPKQFHTNPKTLWSWDRHAAGLQIPYMFDHRCVIAFNRFVRMNDVEIVLSSDWRTRFSLDEMDLIFKINGVVKSPIAYTGVVDTGGNYDLLEGARCREINEYLAENRIAMWCAVDDLDLSGLGSRFVQTDYRMGFGDRSMIEKLERALYPPYR